MSAERNDQTKKVNNRFRPPETNVAFRQGRSGATKTTFFVKNKLPANEFRFDCSGRYAGHDLGVEKLESTQHGPIYHELCLCWAVFSTPRVVKKEGKRA